MTLITFSIPATLTVSGQAPKSVDAITRVPASQATEFAAKHPQAKIVG